MTLRKHIWLIGLIAASALAAAEPEDVIITGERVPENLRTFRWTITNHTDKPIVYFRAPRYLSDMLRPPADWTATMTGDQTTGQGDVIFEARATGYGIYPGQSLSFEIQDTRAERGTKLFRPATVRLSDGRELVIAKTPCPGAEPEYMRQLPLIGLGTMFGALLLWKALRGKSRPAVSAETPDA